MRPALRVGAVADLLVFLGCFGVSATPHVRFGHPRPHQGVDTFSVYRPTSEAHWESKSGPGHTVREGNRALHRREVYIAETLGNDIPVSHPYEYELGMDGMDRSK